MTKIVDIQLKISNDNIELIARRENYVEVSSNDLTSIQNELKKVISFCENLKTGDEKLKEQKENLLEFVTGHLTDDEKARNPKLFDKWEIGKLCLKNSYKNHYNIVYKCKEEHISSYENIPAISEAYWKKLPNEKKLEEGTNPEWAENFDKAEFYSRDLSYPAGVYKKFYNELYKSKGKVPAGEIPSNVSPYWTHIPKKIGNLGI